MIPRVAGLILGLGSDYGDDRLGAIVCARLAQLLPPRTVRYCRSPAELLALDQRAARWIVVDACIGSGEPGSVRRWEWPSAELNTEPLTFAGTHDLSLPAALQLAATLGQLPRRVTIYAVEVAPCRSPEHLLAPLSAPVAAVVESLVQEIVTAWSTFCCRSHDDQREAQAHA